MIKFPSKLVDILTKINARGYEAYFVGGCIRDAILGIETHDIDINTNATTEVLSELFSMYSPTVYETYGNLTFKLDEYNIDITRFRKEGKYIKHRYPTGINFNATLKDDIMRRDFTINALVYHPNKGIGDLVGGLESLKKKEMKTVGNAYLKLNEDYLRMLRMVRFSSKLDFNIEPQAFRILKEHYYRVASLGLSQIENDFLGFLDTKGFVKNALENPWLVTEIITELKEAVEFSQSNIFHSYDLFEHTIRVVDNVNTLELKIAALFHDIGKIKCKKENADGTFSFPGHSSESLRIMNRYFSEWNLDKHTKDTVRKLVLLHDLSIPMNYIEMKKLVSLNGVRFMRKLIALKRSDNLAKSKHAYYQVEKCDNYLMFLDRIEKEKPAVSIKDLAITGDEIDSAPQVRTRILNELINLVIEEKLENNKDALLKAAIRIRDAIY
ncbi:MAG: HD domain-containing protein [Erysipelothrix sp.]|nr:HD domain-containing protein [Erysipelothrix sp.]